MRAWGRLSGLHRFQPEQIAEIAGQIFTQGGEFSSWDALDRVVGETVDGANGNTAFARHFSQADRAAFAHFFLSEEHFQVAFHDFHAPLYTMGRLQDQLYSLLVFSAFQRDLRFLNIILLLYLFNDNFNDTMIIKSYQHATYKILTHTPSTVRGMQPQHG